MGNVVYGDLAVIACTFYITLMGRILALDYGRKRTGVAVSDPLRIIATALDTVPTHTLDTFLDKYISENGVDTIVVGMPRQMDNTPSESYTYIRPFIEKLKKRYPGIAVETEDERFTSLIAKRTIIESGAKKSVRRDKALIDRVSAVIILQSYMEAEKIRKERF